MNKKSTAPPPYEEYSDQFKPLQVEVTHNFEEACRIFKMQVQRAGVLSLYKEKQSYEKPSDKKRRKKREMAERRRLTEMREKMIASGEWERRQKAKDEKRKAKLKRQRKSAQNLLG